MAARPRLFVIVGIVSVSLLTAGCETSDVMDKMHDLNPFGTAKKPLPGDRRAVFPEGVPGVQQGVPPEMMRGAPRQAALEPEPLEAPPQAAPKRAERPKPKPRPRVAQPRPPRPAPPEAAEQQAPARSRPVAAQPASAPPAPAAAPAAAPATGTAWTPPPQQSPPLTVWPDPPKPGTFSR